MPVAKVGNIQGPPGSPGAPGSTGATGTRGSLWSTGPGIPASSGTELPGDMYLDTISGDVYQFMNSFKTTPRK